MEHKIIINYFKKKIVSINKPKHIEKNRINKILIFSVYGRMGDCIILSVLIRELKILMPNAVIDISGNKFFGLVYKYHPSISKIHKLSIKRDGRLKRCFLCDLISIYRMRKEGYDLLIDVSGSSSLYMFLSYIVINPTYLMAFINNKKVNHELNMEDSELKIYTSRANKLEDYLKTIEGPQFILSNRKYDFYYGKDEELRAKEFLSKVKEPKIVAFNIIAGNENRSLTDHEVKAILHGLKKIPNIAVVLISSQKIRNRLFKLIEELNFSNVYLSYDTTIWDAAALISKADVIISPDTSIVHIASALEKKIVSIYVDDLHFISYWKPNCDSFTIVTPSRTLKNHDIKGFNYFPVYETFNIKPAEKEKSIDNLNIRGFSIREVIKATKNYVS